MIRLASEDCKSRQALLSPFFYLSPPRIIGLTLARFLTGFISTGILGYILLIAVPVTGAQYVGTILAACGVYPSIPIMVMWNGNNIGGSTKRSIGMAIQIGLGNSGGVIASFV